MALHQHRFLPLLRLNFLKSSMPSDHLQWNLPGDAVSIYGYTGTR